MAIVVRLILIALLLLLFVILYQKLKPEFRKFRRRSGFQGEWIGSSSEWKKLVRLCHGDEARAQRLRQYEKKANPGIGDDEACQRAVERYYRDNR